MGIRLARSHTNLCYVIQKQEERSLRRLATEWDYARGKYYQLLWGNHTKIRKNMQALGTSAPYTSCANWKRSSYEAVLIRFAHFIYTLPVSCINNILSRDKMVCKLCKSKYKCQAYINWNIPDWEASMIHGYWVLFTYTTQKGNLKTEEAPSCPAGQTCIIRNWVVSIF